MAYDIVKFTDDAGHGVQITPDDVRRTFCANATDQEVQMFLALCATQHLNPFVKDAYLVKYGSGPASIITSRAAIQKRADSNPEYEGTELGVVVVNAAGEIEHRPGEACYKVLGEKLLGGWARVHRKGRKPYYTEVPMDEYNTGRNQWAKMPGTMIAKVAEMHALRGAFPQELNGMYSSEEMAQAEPQPVAATVEPARSANADDIAWLRDATEELVAHGYDRAATKGYLWQEYKAGGIERARGEHKRMLAEAQAQAADGDEADEYEAEDIEF